MGFILLISCRESNTASLDFPSSVALPNFPPYAVVNGMYVRAFAKAGELTNVNGLYRGGDVLALLGRSESKVRRQGQLDWWYEVEGEFGKGWVFGSDLIPCFDLKTAEYESDRLLQEIFD